VLSLPHSPLTAADVDAAIASLEVRIAGLGTVIVAFSGGVDSSVVATLAARALGTNALAVTAVSAALATGELDGARHVASAVGVMHEVISTDEMARAGYRENGPDRCYHCKSELYDRLADVARRRGFAAVLSGANADDEGDWRPGLVAAAEHAVIHPLLEGGFGKDMVRAIAARLSVPSASKPASPCLASRVPHGTAVDPTLLSQIDRAELAVKRLGYRDLRVRHYGDLAKLEFSTDDLGRALGDSDRVRIIDAVKSAGYRFVSVDLEPFRSGNLTVHLLPTRRRTT
jgi:pyridinium-3,5-biscarboxylic acid mononucleotide sulfurtransferase